MFCCAVSFIIKASVSSDSFGVTDVFAQESAVASLATIGSGVGPVISCFDFSTTGANALLNPLSNKI